MKWDDILNALIEFEKSHKLKLKDDQGWILVTKEGLPIYSALKGELDDELVSAICAAILNLSEGAVKEYALGNLKHILIDVGDRNIILSKTGSKAILCMLVKSDSRLGMVFLNIKKK